MFNALNRIISKLDGDAPAPRDKNDGSFGFQVLRNTNLELGIEPWFDFVVGINGRPIDNPDPRLFVQEVRNCAGGSLSLGIWSAKGQRIRELHLSVPSTGTLGLSLQWAPLSAVSNIWHILEVPANSPADMANLFPFSDWILGTPEGTLHGEGGLGELVEDHLGRPLRLWVYNNEYNITREVTITPSRDWGGEGALGCTLGYGHLHRLPPPLSEPVHAPGETLFDGEKPGGRPSADMFVPAQIGTPSPVPSPLGGSGYAPPPAAGGGGDFLTPAQLVAGGGTAAPPPSRSHGKKKKTHTHAGPNLMDDYFKEGEEKSRELDNAPTGKSGGVPPPPKAGGAPKAKAVAENDGDQAPAA